MVLKVSGLSVPEVGLAVPTTDDFVLGLILLSFSSACPFSYFSHTVGMLKWSGTRTGWIISGKSHPKKLKKNLMHLQKTWKAVEQNQHKPVKMFEQQCVKLGHYCSVFNKNNNLISF